MSLKKLILLSLPLIGTVNLFAQADTFRTRFPADKALNNNPNLKPGIKDTLIRDTVKKKAHTINKYGNNNGKSATNYHKKDTTSNKQLTK
jgi:hypothetical protein